MTIRMADILTDLREDHRNMAIMLNLLEREANHIRKDEEPDYELMHDIMRYMTVYSDAVHHPNENVLYEAMRKESPKLAEGLERVGPEHRDIAELGESLRNDVEAIAAGTAVERNRLIDDAVNYIKHLRQHMAWEEEDLFRRADSLVKAESSMFPDISNIDQPDPVFGASRDRSFANLLQNIKDFSNQ